MTKQRSLGGIGTDTFHSLGGVSTETLQSLGAAELLPLVESGGVGLGEVPLGCVAVEEVVTEVTPMLSTVHEETDSPPRPSTHTEVQVEVHRDPSTSVSSGSSSGATSTDTKREVSISRMSSQSTLRAVSPDTKLDQSESKVTEANVKVDQSSFKNVSEVKVDRKSVDDATVCSLKDTRKARPLLRSSTEYKDTYVPTAPLVRGDSEGCWQSGSQGRVMGHTADLRRDMSHKWTKELARLDPSARKQSMKPDPPLRYDSKLRRDSSIQHDSSIRYDSSIREDTFIRQDWSDQHDSLPKLPPAVRHDCSVRIFQSVRPNPPTRFDSSLVRPDPLTRLDSSHVRPNPSARLESSLDFSHSKDPPLRHATVEISSRRASLAFLPRGMSLDSRTSSRRLSAPLKTTSCTEHSKIDHPDSHSAIRTHSSVDKSRPDSRLMSVGRSLGSVDRSRLDGCPGRPRLPPHPPPPPGRPAPIERRDTAPIRTGILAGQSTGSFKSLSPRRHSVGCRAVSPPKPPPGGRPVWCMRPRDGRHSFSMEISSSVDRHTYR